MVDRRILKSQQAIKEAIIELMSEKNFDQITIQDISDRANVGRRTIYHHYLDKFDLLDKLIEEHMDELRKLCQSATELDFIDANLIWFEYFERNFLFFSTMLKSKGASAFRNQFLEFVMEELSGDVNIYEGMNQGLNKEVVLRFFGSAIVGVVEAYFTKDFPAPPQAVAEQLGLLLERNL